MENSEMPRMEVGRYRGVPIDQIPNSYLRWMLGQDFPKEILEIAKRKVEASPYSNEPLFVSRHALDQFSLRFLHLWVTYVTTHQEGISTFLVMLAEEAWKDGKDVSKNRYNKDGIIKEMNGIKFVFDQSQSFPEYRELVTVM